MTNTLSKLKLKTNDSSVFIGLLPTNLAVSITDAGGGIYFDISVNDKHFEKNKTQSKDSPCIQRPTAFKSGSKHVKIQEVASILTFQ